jgi:mediator of RNA polymerase II transcription subunit 5
MDQTTDSRRALRDSLQYWSSFVDKCIAKRLSTEAFDEYVPLIQAEHPLPPFFIAYLFLRPMAYNGYTLDPRIPPYIQILSRLGHVDAPSILKVLFKFSSLHAQLKPLPETEITELDTVMDGISHGPRRWRSSSWAEEVMFYHVIKLIVEGTAFRDSRTVLELLTVITKWMELFTAVSNVFARDVMGELQSSQAREDMDVAKAAFVPLLLRLVELPALARAISGPNAKGMM